MGVLSTNVGGGSETLITTMFDRNIAYIGLGPVIEEEESDLIDIPFENIQIGKHYEIAGRVCLILDKTEYESLCLFSDGSSVWVDCQDVTMYELIGEKYD